MRVWSQSVSKQSKRSHTVHESNRAAVHHSRIGAILNLHSKSSSAVKLPDYGASADCATCPSHVILANGRQTGRIVAGQCADCRIADTFTVLPCPLTGTRPMLTANVGSARRVCIWQL